jgi:hypothetical protein
MTKDIILNIISDNWELFNNYLNVRLSTYFNDDYRNNLEVCHKTHAIFKEKFIECDPNDDKDHICFRCLDNFDLKISVKITEIRRHATVKNLIKC